MAPGLVVDLHDASDTSINLSNPVAKQPSAITTSELTTTSPPSSPPAPLDPTLVLHPSTITTDFDLLRFHAAAYAQLGKSRDQSSSSKDSISKKNDIDEDKVIYSTNLISSPYNSPGHYLSLSSPSLPFPSLLFAKALTALAPTGPDYATAKYTEALNFGRVLEVLREEVAALSSTTTTSSLGGGYVYPASDFYVVVFRSKLKAGIDLDYLYKLDFESHREACESGGLLKYWFGKTDNENRNLATCEYSISPSLLPSHFIFLAAFHSFQLPPSSTIISCCNRILIHQHQASGTPAPTPTKAASDPGISKRERPAANCTRRLCLGRGSLVSRRERGGGGVWSGFERQVYRRQSVGLGVRVEGRE